MAGVRSIAAISLHLVEAAFARSPLPTYIACYAPQFYQFVAFCEPDERPSRL